MATISEQWTTPLPDGVPSTHKEHTESRTTILLPNDHSAFLNPPQQFNRDMSVAVIRAWNERRIEEATKKHNSKPIKGRGRKGGKGKGGPKQETSESAETAAEERAPDAVEEPVAGPSKEVGLVRWSRREVLTAVQVHAEEYQDSRSAFRHGASSYPICQGNPERQVRYHQYASELC